MFLKNRLSNAGAPHLHSLRNTCSAVLYRDRSLTHPLHPLTKTDTRGFPSNKGCCLLLCWAFKALHVHQTGIFKTYLLQTCFTILRTEFTSPDDKIIKSITEPRQGICQIFRSGKQPLWRARQRLRELHPALPWVRVQILLYGHMTLLQDSKRVEKHPFSRKLHCFSLIKTARMVIHTPLIALGEVNVRAGASK